MANLAKKKGISLSTVFILLLSQFANFLILGAVPVNAGLSLGAAINVTPGGIKRASHKNPVIYENKIVWQDNRNGNWDIYMKDLSSGVESRLTSNGTNQFQPAIYGDRVAWVDVRNGNRDIFIKDLVSGDTTAVVSNSSEQLRPRLYSDTLGWEEFTGPLAGPSEVNIKNLTSGLVSKMSSSSQADSVDLWANWVGWRDRSTGVWVKDLLTGIDSHVSSGSVGFSGYMKPAIFGDSSVWNEAGAQSGIYMKDLVTSTETSLSAGTQQYNPDVYDNYVVWQDNSSGNPKVMVKNLTSGVVEPVSPGSLAPQEKPQIWGNVVVWQDKRSGEWDVFMKDLSSGVISQVNSNESLLPADQFRGDIDGGKVVWVDNRKDAPGLYFKDLSGGSESRFRAAGIPPSSTQQWNPRISGNNVVWADTENSPFGIYMTDLSTLVETPISAGTLQYRPAISGTKIVWENASSGWNTQSVYLKELGGPPSAPISAFTGQFRPDISGDDIVWSQNGGGLVGGGIFQKDLVTSNITPLSSFFDNVGVGEPAVDGDNVVWATSGKVRHGNLATGVQQVLSSASVIGAPAIDGNLVVWTEFSSIDGSDVFVYDLSTGVKMPITTASGRQEEPRVSGNRVIWTDWRNGHADIYSRTVSQNDEPTISGHVTHFAGQAIADAAVKALPVDGSGNPDLSRPELDTVSDGSGYYLFNNPAAGGYKILFNPPPASSYVPIFYDQKDSTSSATVITVGPGDDLSGIDAQMYRTNTIYGQVRDTSGTPIRWIDVWVFDQNYDFLDWGQTDANGNYSIGDLAAGNYKVEFYDWNGDHVAEFYNDKPNFENADIVSVSDNLSTTGIDATLTPLGPIVNDQYEPDNVMGQAKQIAANGSVQTHTIYPQGDTDWIKFEGEASQTVVIETLHLSDEMDTFIYLYDSSGALLALNDDNFDLDSMINYHLPYSGTFFVNTRHFDDGYGTGQYDIRVTLPDQTLPTDPTLSSPSHTKGVWSNDHTVDLAWPAVDAPGGATDSNSGVDGFSVSWSQNTTALPDAAKNLEEIVTSTNSGLLANGTWWANLRTVDNAGNWTSTVHYGPFKIDKAKPTGTVSINSGATYTKSTAVTLNLSASDTGGSGLSKMRFKNDSGTWSGWYPYSSSKSWTLASTNGTRRVYAQFKDTAGNISNAVSDTIFLDTRKPTASMKVPYLSTDQTKNTKFRITWKGSDKSPASKIASYDVQKKVHGRGWKRFKTNTTKKAAYFKGRPGKNYYFRVRSKDRAGNVGRYSKAKRTIVPFDNNSRVKNHASFGSRKRNKRAYKNTLRYTTRAGASITYRFRGRGVYLITTKAKNRSKARIYIDNKRVRTINTYSKRTRYRKVVFKRLWKKRRNHTIKIVNVGNKRRLDIDALGVKE